MSDDKQYAGIVGFVFKEPEHVTTKTGKGIRRLLVAEANSRNSFYSLSVWDEAHGKISIEAGDLVAASGGYTENTKDGTTFKNISCRQFVNLGNGNGEQSADGGGPSSKKAEQEDPF